MKARSHRDLIVWQKAMDLAVISCAVARSFPPSEQFGLATQLTRAAVSVAANIAEGSGRGAPRDYLRFLAIAQGSLNETETYLILAQRLGYIPSDEAERGLQTVAEVGRMLTALRRRLRANPRPSA